MVGKLACARDARGLLAGLLSFGFLKIVGEPRSIALAFETAMDEARAQARIDEAEAKGIELPKKSPSPNWSAGRPAESAC